MYKKIKEATSFSSSSAFIIIIVLVVVSVTAIVIGGGDGFTRKYRGIDLREFSSKMLLAQTGVVGKILEFVPNGNEFDLNLRPIELDGSVLGESERYVASVVPPREGDTPFSYRPEEGLRVTQGYPLLRDYVDGLGLGADDVDAEGGLPDIPGMVVCTDGAGGDFSVFFEDIAYETGVGFDDPALGQARQDVVCDVLDEFEDVLLLNQTDLNPGIVVQSSREGTPEFSLSVVSPQYVGGSGFVSTLLTDYLRSGVRRSTTSFGDNVSVLGINSGFMRFNFRNVDWSVDTGSVEDFDLATVTRQNMLRLLGFGSFLGHEQENILSSSWKRWSEWDRMIVDSETNFILGDGGVMFGLTEDIDSSSASSYDERLTEGGVGLLSFALPDVSAIPSAGSFIPYEIFTSDSFQKGQSLAGLADPNAVSHPVLEAGDVKTLVQAEKEILCFLGLAVDGVEGCNAPRTVANNIYIERQNNKAVCVNLFDGVHNSVAGQFEVVGNISELTGNVNLNDSNIFTLYDTPCPGADFTPVDKATFDADHATNNTSEAVAFAWSPNQTEDLYREYVRFAYDIKDTTSNRITDRRQVAIHKCAVFRTGNQLCNGDFQYSGAASPVDLKLSSLERVLDNDGNSIISCLSTTLPGWCAQGVQDGFSQEFGYTWHPYLLKDNPIAYDTPVNIQEMKRYAGGSTGAIVQRLRSPLELNTTYTISGLVHVTEDGLRPAVWYGGEESVLPQPDGTFHVVYPELLADLNTPTMSKIEITLPTSTCDDGIDNDGDGYVDLFDQECGNDPLGNESDIEWKPFSLNITTGSSEVTHIAFGGSNNNGFVLFDDLKVQFTSECTDCFADIDGNCSIDTNDFIGLLTLFDTNCPNGTEGCAGDITFDGVINSGDLIQFLAEFGQSCPTEEEQAESIIGEEPGGIGTGFDLGESIVVLSDQESVNNLAGIDIDVALLEEEQIVPNSNGFSANYVMTITNTTNRDLEDLSLVGVVPVMMTYGEHVATKENIGYARSSNTITIPELDGQDEVRLYFKLDVSENLCGQARRDSEGLGYQALVDLDLCDSYQTILEKQYGIERDKFGNLIRKGSSSGSNDVIEDDGGLGGVPNCNDGIDNDSDGYIDLSDGGCNLDPLGNESDAFEGGVTQCNDGIDNDSDTRIDRTDPHCPDAVDNYEGS